MRKGWINETFTQIYSEEGIQEFMQDIQER